MKKTLVLMLGCKSLVGKDTFANFPLVHDNFLRLAFADELKTTVARLFDLSEEQVFGKLKDVEDERYPNLYDPPMFTERHGLFTEYTPNPEYKPFFTPRRLLQVIGTEQLRSLFPEIWTSFVFRYIQDYVERGINRFVITDLRFRNEALAGERFAAQNDWVEVKKIRIDRPGVEALTGAGHASENDLNDYEGWDHIITNDGDLDSYESKVTCLVRGWL